MNNREKFIWEFLLGLAVVFGIGLACFLVACSPLKSAAEADYLAEQLACVDQSHSKSEAETCRNAVKARWAADGAPDVAITETVSDGGAK